VGVGVPDPIGEVDNKVVHQVLLIIWKVLDQGGVLHNRVLLGNILMAKVRMDNKVLMGVLMGVLKVMAVVHLMVGVLWEGTQISHQGTNMLLSTFLQINVD